MAHQIGHAAAVAPLIVIPGINLELGAIHHQGGEGIDDGTAAVVDIIDGN